MKESVCWTSYPSRPSEDGSRTQLYRNRNRWRALSAKEKTPIMSAAKFVVKISWWFPGCRGYRPSGVATRHWRSLLVGRWLTEELLHPLTGLVFNPAGWLATLLIYTGVRWGSRLSRRQPDPRQVVLGYVVPVAVKRLLQSKRLTWP